MGKGDRKTKKGKIRIGSYGKLRPRKKDTDTFVPKKTEKVKEEQSKEQVETKKKTAAKKTTKKKTVAKKTTKKKTATKRKA